MTGHNEMLVWAASQLKNRKFAKKKLARDSGVLYCFFASPGLAPWRGSSAG